MGSRAAPRHAADAWARAMLPAAGSACPVQDLLASSASGGWGLPWLASLPDSRVEMAAPTSANAWEGGGAWLCEQCWVKLECILVWMCSGGCGCAWASPSASAAPTERAHLGSTTYNMIDVPVTSLDAYF